MSLWQVTSNFDEGDLVSIEFMQVICLTCWIEYYAPYAEMPDILAGIG